MDVPDDLGDRGSRLWSWTLDRFSLGDPEVAMLHEAARTLDLLDQLQADIAASGVTVDGSKGQPVLNPSIAEARLQRGVLAQLLYRLDIPDDVGGVT